jgi:SAV_6107-like HEPN
MSVAVASREEAEQAALPMPSRPPAAPAAVALLAQARRGLIEAGNELDPAERFIASYLSALRAAAGPASVWMLLETAAPELREWAAFFAANSATQAAVQAGITGRLNAAMADDLLAQSARFVELARRVVHPNTGASP